MELKTSLYEIHEAYGGKIVPFAGYLLPVQYRGGIIAEHMAVRTACGLFDVSHMGEIICKGPDALANLNYILTNDFTGMYDGQARYSPMCNEHGGVVDDLIVYRIREDCYFIVVNASNKEKDFAWMKAHEFGDVVLEDISAKVAQIALQGPKADAILKKLAAEEDIPKKYYSCTWKRQVAGTECIISKTGYTGENGYELYMEETQAPKVWEALMEAGKEYGLTPCGLGARDTLRLEAAMPLYGHEMDDTITPLETGLGFAVKMGKDDFIGKEAFLQSGVPARERIGIKVTGRGIIREHCPIYLGDREIGYATSGTQCPYVNAPVAMALVEAGAVSLNQEVEAEVRGRRVAAHVVALPFYKKQK